MNELKTKIEILRNKVIVSVQAQDNEPLNKPEHLLAISESVINGGAGGLRLCGEGNIKFIKDKVNVPIIGLTKIQPTPINFLDVVFITASLKDARKLLDLGIECIAIDGTGRLRLDGSTLDDQIKLIKKEKRLVMADVATFEDGMSAAEKGADLISTTLSGYTKETRYKTNEGPDFKLLEELMEECPVPVILEGRIWNPEDVKTAFEIGAFAVIIGTAITRPHLITKRFVSSVPQT